MVAEPKASANSTMLPSSGLVTIKVAENSAVEALSPRKLASQKPAYCRTRPVWTRLKVLRKIR